MKNAKIHQIVTAGMIAAIYVALTYIFNAISFGEIQVRVSEALTILPVFTAAAVPGLFIGCLIANILGSALLPDIIFGSLATLVGALFTRMLRRAHPFLAPLPPIAANALVVPFVLHYAYMVPVPIPFLMLTVGVGEILSCGVLGLILYYALRPHRDALFPER